MSVSGLPAAMAIRDKIAKGEVGRVVIIGAGAIGVEMAEAVSDLWGLETTLVEVTPQILPGVLEPGLARMVAKHLRDKGVTLHLEESVQEIRPHSGAEAALEVVTARNVIPADLVIIAVGAVPNTELARQAGLSVSAGGGIVVNRASRPPTPTFTPAATASTTTTSSPANPSISPRGPWPTVRDGSSAPTWPGVPPPSTASSAPSP